jgi:hypothetical protein
LILYVNPIPIGEVTVIVPVATVQVGCVTLTVGATGIAGCAFTTAEIAGDVHSAEFLTVTLYVAFAATPVNVVDVW